jgi:putative hydrolase of HD superfamily
MCIADIKGLNSEKLLRLLLLHDIHEALTGDHDPISKRIIGEEKLWEMAKNAIQKMLNGLPRKLREQYYSLWLEFNEGVTNEAKLAREIDQLELTMQALEYEKDGYDAQRLSIFWKNAENKIVETSELFDALKETRDSYC